MLTFSHRRPYGDCILFRMGSGSFPILYMWQARDWYQHTLNFNIQVLALFYIFQLPVSKWTPLCLMQLIPVRRHGWSSSLCNAREGWLPQGNPLLAWLNPGASLWINFRHIYWTWNIPEVLGQPVIHLQFWHISTDFEEGHRNVWTCWCSASGSCSSLSLHLHQYLFMYFLISIDTKIWRGSTNILECQLQEPSWLEFTPKGAASLSKGRREKLLSLQWLSVTVSESTCNDEYMAILLLGIKLDSFLWTVTGDPTFSLAPSYAGFLLTSLHSRKTV